MKRRPTGVKKLFGIFLAVVFTLQMSFPALNAYGAETYQYPFQNPNLPLKKRVDDLISRLTLDEKVSLLHQYQPAIPRLGIKSFRTGTEALHGVSWLGKATVFPQATGFANTWDENLIKKVGSAVGDEVRAFHKKDPVNVGLSVWAPVVDLQRDPRAGRNEEAYGEDPYLTGRISQAYSTGLKGEHPKYIKTIPTLKHFLGYNNEENRGASSSSLDPRNLYEYQLKSFETAIASKSALSMMPAYNAINGKPAILSPLINDVVKKDWADKFFVVSDAFDVSGIKNDHKYVDTMAEAAALTIKAGVDSFTDQDKNSDVVIGWIKEALNQGLLVEADIDKAVRNILEVRFLTGEFDPPGLNPYANIDVNVINSKEHQKLALKAAQKQLVLLKNEENALPLKKDAKGKVAVIGPLADQVFNDFYSGTFPYTVSTLDGIKTKVDKDKIVFSRGVNQIALKSVSTGKYVTASPSGNENLAANSESIGKNETFSLYDFGWNQYLLRSHANDKYVSNTGSDDVKNNESAPGDQEDRPGTQDWFTYQNYNLEKQNDGTYSLYNYQWGHWDTGLKGGRYVTVENEAPHKLKATKSSVTGNTEKFEQKMVVNGEKEAQEAARNAEAAVVVVGDQTMLNARETIDRQDITLPPSQEALIQKVAAVNPNTIVVVISGYPMAMPKVENNPNVKAILYSAHGGQEEGRAIADALFGDYAPAGRLNQTWYASVDQLPDMMEYDIIKGKRTYQYFDGKPLYPFGHGLTYTNFEYKNLNIKNKTVKANDTVTVTVDVKNTGSTASDEVVQLYTRAEESRVQRPLKELKGFQRLSFKPGETKRVTFRLPVKDLAFWDVTREKYTVESGTYTIMAGKSSEDIQLTEKLKVKGETIKSRDLSVETKAENYDDYHGVKMVEESKTGDYAVGETDPGDWIAFRDADLKKDLTGFQAKVASANGGGHIEIRLDDPARGQRIGTVAVQDTGGWQKWTTVQTRVNEVKGKHDVYLVFKGNINIDTFRFVGKRK
ncbi:glycoside hydrolase family 3 C-terminal domain-containing protein [Paenactinomyces guangxiensis]|uniref:Glycoside hydrolase family 3 C-terminal domain-containing protein n=1 Tax=Paenactinomyces guangxiensis TaxID=1490290 RepID=A0A7W2A7Q0_9BACL|nr:glycoside hydrolase family 3 protein [Paenactinomyces guangxiensis]MBA4493820.1 glycoside hydrolase family 3 C-terminal domain-containing protein [Paenactinomyces guangxiensis]MBH8591286.1 glycoside hydrolase family 3 C-terminal domain-containing protein [Paenactinomyces guangxiensis]